MKGVSTPTNFSNYEGGKPFEVDVDYLEKEKSWKYCGGLSPRR